MGAILHVLRVFVVGHKRAHKATHAVAPHAAFVILACEKARLAHLVVEHDEQIGHEGTKAQSNKERARHDEEQGKQVEDVRRSIQPRKRLAHGVDAVRERKRRMNELEEVGHHLDGIHARRTRYLHDQQEDAQRLADVAKRLHQRVDEIHIRERAHRAGQHEQHRVAAIDAQQDVDAANRLRLQKRQNDEQQPAPEVALPRRCLREAHDLDLHKRHQNEASYPQGQVGVERGNRRTVVRNGIELGGGHLHGCRDERTRVFDVDAKELREFFHLERIANGPYVLHGAT